MGVEVQRSRGGGADGVEVDLSGAIAPCAPPTGAPGTTPRGRRWLSPDMDLAQFFPVSLARTLDTACGGALADPEHDEAAAVGLRRILCAVVGVGVGVGVVGVGASFSFWRPLQPFSASSSSLSLLRHRQFRHLNGETKETGRKKAKSEVDPQFLKPTDRKYVIILKIYLYFIPKYVRFLPYNDFIMSIILFKKVFFPAQEVLLTCSADKVRGDRRRQEGKCSKKDLPDFKE